MQNIVISQGAKVFTFRVNVIQDLSSGAPWEDSDIHGPVTGWTSRNKKPGEWVLNTDGGSKRYYDYAQACQLAQRDGWGLRPEKLAAFVKNLGHSPSAKELAAETARIDFEYLRAWCNDEWRYVGIDVTLLDEDGEETSISSSLWGVEDHDDYPAQVAQELAAELMAGYRKNWGEVERQTYALINKEAN